MKNYHLTFDRKKASWKLLEGSRKKAKRIFHKKTKRASIQQSAQIIRKRGGGSLKIHYKEKSGIQEERTLGRPDPRRSKG